MGVGEEIYINVFQLKKESNEKNRKDFIISRSFYFNDNNESHFKRFAKKFAFDENYRSKCIDKTIRWIRLSSWYDYNSSYYYDIFQTITAADAFDKVAMRKMREQSKNTYRRCLKLYNILNEKLEWLESTKEYLLNSKKEFSKSKAELEKNDLDIEKAVVLFDRIPDVKTKSSCQGKGNGIVLEEWAYGKIWIPEVHQFRANIIFESIPKRIASDLNDFLLEKDVGMFRRGKAFSLNPEKNNDFIKCLKDFAIAFC